MQSFDQKSHHKAKIEGQGKVRPVNVGHVNVYLIETETGHILVDTGMPHKEKKLDQVFETAGVDSKGVRLIILTHGHMDHVGAIAYAQRITGAQVLCHRSIAERLANGEIEAAVPQNLAGRLLNFMTGLAGSSFEGTKADILVDDEFDLNEYGIAGKIIHTPGHSASSISIVLDNGEALLGDMVRERSSGEIVLGMFYEDEPLLFESLDKVMALEPRTIYLSHGKCIDNDTLKSFIETKQRDQKRRPKNV